MKPQNPQILYQAMYKLCMAGIVQNQLSITACGTNSVYQTLGCQAHIGYGVEISFYTIAFHVLYTIAFHVLSCAFEKILKGSGFVA